MKIKDITSQVDFLNNDDELLPITKCVCGEEFDSWEFCVSIYENEAHSCPKCGRKFFFRLGIRVFEVEEENVQKV